MLFRSDVPDGLYVQVVSGDWHSCALTVDGTAVCWGDDLWGQASPPESGGPYSELGAGPDFTWGREERDGFVFTRCWGRCGLPPAAASTGSR